MNFIPTKESIVQKIQWLKEKAFWLIVILLASATVFFIALWIALIILFFLQPRPYSYSTPPEFQAKRQTNFKLFAVFENQQLKANLCNEEGYVYAGNSMSQEEFCSFKYQNMPKLNGPFDITLMGLSPIEVRYASVCILRLPKQLPQLIGNTTEQESFRPTPQYRYACQKYRVYNSMHIANSLDQSALVFLEVEIELTDKGFESFQGANIGLKFQEDAKSSWKFFIDYYWLLSFIFSLCLAAWTAFVVFALGFAWIVALVLKERQIQEERLLRSAKKSE